MTAERATEPCTRREKAVELIADSMRRRGFGEYANQHAEQIMAEAVAEAASDGAHYEAGDYDALCANCGRLTIEHLCEAAQGAAPRAEGLTDCRDGHDERLTMDFDGEPIRCIRCKAPAAPRAEWLDSTRQRIIENTLLTTAGYFSWGGDAWIHEDDEGTVLDRGDAITDALARLAPQERRDND